MAKRPTNLMDLPPEEREQRLECMGLTEAEYLATLEANRKAADTATDAVPVRVPEKFKDNPLGD